jgi:hypothetical protein
MRCIRFPFLLLLSVIGFRGNLSLSAENGGNPPPISMANPASLIGLTLEEILAGLGVPRSVYAVRGHEEWQDDVVFVYDMGDFYVYKDRVWQIGLKSAYNVSVGDRREALALTLGEKTRHFDTYAVYSFDDYSWPILMRFNFDQTDKVSAIFIYRSDF